MNRWQLLPLAALWSGCFRVEGTPDGNSGNPSDDTADTAYDTADSVCEDAPVVTYANFGEGFLLSNCQSCHASTTTNRNGAPEGVTFDTVKEVWTWSTRILARSTGEEADMPPEGGVSEYDITLLEFWLACGIDGT